MDKIEFIKNVNKMQEKTVQIRGNIVNASIQIEMLIDSILTNYFILSEKQSDFITKFLYDELCSANLKIKVINRLGLLDKQKGIKKDIEDLFYIRNMVAHSPPVLSTNIPLIFSSKKKIPENLDDLNKKFIDKYEKIKPALLEVLYNLINERKPIQTNH